MTQSYVYETAEAAAARFKGEDPGFIYSRYANPTVAMFEERMRLLEGAGAARATASGMAAVTAVFLCHLRAGDHVVAAKALFGSCRYVVEDLLPRYGIASTLIDGRDLGQWKKAVKKGKTKAFFLESPTNPTLDVIDIAGGRRDRPQGRRAAHRRQRLRHAGPAEAVRARRRHRRLLGDQAHRRPGPLPRRRHPGGREIRRRPSAHLPAPDRTVAQPVQRLGAPQGTGNARAPRRARRRRTRSRSPTASPPTAR